MSDMMYIGGYGTRSICRVRLDDGRMSLLGCFDAVNASYLCFSGDGKTLYAVGETRRFRGADGGSVQSYAIGEEGSLKQTSMAPTRGMDPCHLTVTGNVLLVSNYSSGSLSRFLLEPDGTIGDALPLILHEGHGRDPLRQEGPHVHQAQMTPGGWIAVCDLGLDAVMFYPTPEITSAAPAARKVSVPAGFGPRHCVFPRGRDTWYVLCELRSELLIYRGGPEEASLIGRVPVGDSFSPNQPAALRLSPDGTMLAATGRGQDVITLFRLGDNGLPARLTEVSSGGACPRDVQFTPDGRYLVCANQVSGTLTAFALNDGHLERAGSLSLPSMAPACVLFAAGQKEED